MDADEYETPVDFRDRAEAEEEKKNTPGKNPTTTTTSSSIASSSRMAVSAASAPVNLGNMRNKNTIRFHHEQLQHQQQLGRNVEDNSGTATPGANSFNSSPLMWNSSTPQRIKSRRRLEQKIRHRSKHRAAAMSTFPQNVNAPPDDDDDAKKEDAPTSNLPKALTDLLLQSAMLGIGTTAKLSKPTLELARNTLLPQIILPLLLEIWQQYAPTRLQTWMKVVPTSLKNVGNLLWDTEAGQALGNKAGKLGENVVDMASSEVARQCWIDATISLIKLMESLHTPEVKALLDQCAVGLCRFIDVLSSGKAKQVWFDASDAIWALIEVGSDEVMVTSLAEGCAQVCFALENERDSLKERRGKDGAGGGSGDKMQKLLASKRRRERDRRQTGTYPPGKAVLSEEGGRDGFEEALLDGLDGYINSQEGNEDEFEDQIYDNIDNNIAEADDGPPQRVIVPTSSSENIECPSALDNDNNDQEEAINANIVNDDSESEITTEIEDLRIGDEEDPIDYDDVHTQSSASEKEPSSSRQGRNPIAYEQDGRVDYAQSLQNQIDELDWDQQRPNDNDSSRGSEMYDTFDEPILQFYRKLNEVLVETRKESKLVENLQYSARDDRRSKDENAAADSAANIGASTKAQLIPKGPFSVPMKYWKLILVASICGVATMCMLWFMLGCYGFYMLFIGGGRQVVYHPHPTMNTMQQQPSNNIVIQLVTSKGGGEEVVNNECGASTNNNEGAGTKEAKPVPVTVTLDDWNEMKLGVDKAIEQQTLEEQENKWFHL